MKKISALLFTLLFYAYSTAFAATSEWKINEISGAKTRLIASFYQDGETTKLIAGLEFNLPSGWKVYGPDSDGIGVPPRIDLSGSQNYESHEISWPKAEMIEEKIVDQTFKYSIYHNEVILPIEIKIKKSAQDTNDSTNLLAKIEYGICKDVCIPVSEDFVLNVQNAQDSKALEQIQKFYPKQIISGTETPASTQTNDNSNSNILSWIIAAIIGGAILNIMPCVLPIISIKLLSVINHLETEISRIRFAFFATICGIISCFFVFAILALIIKLAGNSFGWGLQFQNPYYLIFLAIILVFFTANMLGFFEITFDQFAANFLNKKINQFSDRKNIFIPNFLSGILAVLLATPCSAPILGSAISFALSQTIFDIFLIFIAIGIGFASPYFILIAVPKLVYLLPKPGMWMVKIKKILALLLATTVAWLLYILAGNIGLIATIVVAITILLALLCIELKSKFIKYFAIIFLISSSFILPSQFNFIATKENSKNGWMKFDEAVLNSLVSQGKIVVVDVTADWCLTCKVNKLTVFDDKEIIEKLSDANIVTMRADITKPDPQVMEFLRKHNRFAIPFNAVYGPSAKSGLLTSELLTKKQLLELIEKAK